MAGLQIDTPWASGWRPEFIGTLIFVLRGDEVLLIHKKTGHGAGRINGPGGKLDPGEDVLACARREVAEEVGLRIADPRVCAELRFVERNGPQWLGFALTAEQFSGQPTQTREADPFWCRIRDIPYQRMWPDDALWLPPVLADVSAGGAEVRVWDFLFDDGRLLEHAVASTRSMWEHVRG